MERLRFVAGPEAYNTIRKVGFNGEMIKVVAAAAGGPKWFTTYGLMRYIIADLLKPDQECYLIGSSVGAWQMTAAMSPRPREAIDALKDSYANHIYSENATEEEISAACASFINNMIGPFGKHIVSKDHKKSLHIITTYIKQGINGDGKLLLGSALGMTALANMFSRSYMKFFIDRVIYSTKDSLPFDIDADVLNTRIKLLNKSKLQKVLLASGAIPFLMKGISDIENKNEGYYWDGGISDYHLSLPYSIDENQIILHPHFGPDVLAGWFDKKLPWKRIAPESHMSKVLLVYPSEAYVQSLPKGRISELKDFKYFGVNQKERIRYWNAIADQSHQLADELHEVISTDKMADRIKPYKAK